MNKLHPRRGITITEVLISIGILSVGLLSVASIFPVGSHYLASADRYDRSSAVGQAAFADLVARGMLSPSAWQMWDNEAAKRFTKSFGRAQATSGFSNTQYFGTMLVLDPRGAAGVEYGGGNNGLRAARNFPATNRTVSGSTNDPWGPWNNSWPVRRLTVLQNHDLQNNDQPVQPEVALRLFGSRDDLSLEFPTQSDSPSIQQWDTENDASDDVLLTRRWQGNYSWLVTIAPPSLAAQDALHTDPSAYYYDVSVVVFQGRQVPEQSPTGSTNALLNGFSNLLDNERITEAQVISTGTGGGELKLTHVSHNSESQNEDPYKNLKNNEWILLFGPHPQSRSERPMLFAQWYRVVSIETKNLPETERIVSLRGPDWPWEPGTTVANDLRVGIFSGAVSVYNKKMRLEGTSVWSMQ